MGIKDLNRFIRANCSEEAVKRVQLCELNGKKIAVDISIYLYKYAGDGALIENMYSLLALFRQYNIIPIFVFEGKCPAEKKALLAKRREDKQSAEKEYNVMKNALETNKDAMEESEKQELLTSMDLLKKQFVYIKKEQINNVKILIRSFGMTYYDAPGEADELCASLVIKKKVWATLSEDMDMFVYGCNRVLRYLSLLNHNVVVYNTKLILEELGLTQEEFRQICILSGTDYSQNLENSCKCNLMNSLKMFKKYKKALKKEEKSKEKEKYNNCDSYSLSNYYKWLLENTNYIDNYSILLNIYDMFDLTSERHCQIEVFDNIKIMNGPVDMQAMKPLLMEEGFIF
jgi:5'-3' exonuclease